MSAKDVRVGSEIPPLRKVAYQRLLHEQVFSDTSIHNTEYARSKGYAGALVSGYVLGCYVSEMLVNFFGRSWLRGGKLEVNFVNGGVQDGDEVVCRGIVVERIEEEAGVRLNLDIRMEKGQGVEVVVGTASGIVG